MWVICSSLSFRFFCPRTGLSRLLSLFRPGLGFLELTNLVHHVQQYSLFPRSNDDCIAPPRWKVRLRKEFPVSLQDRSAFLSLGLGHRNITSIGEGNSSSLRCKPLLMTSSTVEPSSSLSFGFGSFCSSLAFSQSWDGRRSSRAKEIRGGGISRSSASITNVLATNLVGSEITR